MASAPANLNSFIRLTKSSAFIGLSIVSVSVTTTPSPITSVVPNISFDFLSSSSNSSEAYSLESNF